MKTAHLALASTASKLRVDAMQRLAEISDHGCEAASARAFEEGRLAVLDALGFPLLPGWPVEDTDETIRQRRLDLDEALRARGTSRPDRDPIAFEPIVRRETPPLLSNHRPDCSLRALSVSVHGSKAMTCTCDYPARAAQYRKPMTEPESAEPAVEAAETDDVPAEAEETAVADDDA